MPTAVPITFPNQQRPGAHRPNGSFVDNPVMISPNMPWRGSPMSYSILARSLGTKNSFSSFMGTSPGPLSAAFSELNDFRVNGVPSSIESEAGKILRALHGEESLNKDLIQNYSCCGMELADLHALLEHFEEVHVVVLDSPSLRPTTTAHPSTGADMNMDDDDSSEPQSAFDPDAMDLDSGPSSSSGSTPPSTPPIDIAGALINSASTLFDNSNLVIRTSSRALSKAAASGSMSGYNTPRGISPHPTTPGAERSEASLFNPYASYSDFSALMPGTVRTPNHQSPPPNAIKGDPNSPTSSNSSANHLNNNGNPTVLTSIPPALLFSPSTQTTPNGSPMQSRTGTPTPSGSGLSRAGSLNNGGGVTSASLMSLANANHGASTTTGGGGASSGKKGSISGVSGSHYPHSPSTPGASTSSSSNGGNGGGSSLVAKPFRCPTIGCNKSYKQANGLKYHITHGQCNFMPRDPALDGLNESEADEKARPYVCQVGPCTRRYKNMNGLRYHYQHSGQHGAVGLALLASGQHSLQTGLKDAGVELPPQVKEQHILAAQALQRQQQLASQHPTSPSSTHSTATVTATTSTVPQPQYLSQLQQQQAHQHQLLQQQQAHAQAQASQAQTPVTTTGMSAQAIDARALAEQASRLQREREQEAMAALIQQRLPAQKTPPSASVLLGSSGGAGVRTTPTPTLYATANVNKATAHVSKRESESFAMQM